MTSLQIIIITAFILGFAAMFVKLFEKPKQVRGGGEKDPEPKDKPDTDERII